MLDSLKIYWDNGNLKREESYLNGVRHGKTSNWDECGIKRIQHSYQFGKYHGIDIAWNQNGLKVFINTHINGFYTGVEVGFLY
jgi:antitoxin component YwqK of YwqJK toxin-antitoxin module